MATRTPTDSDGGSERKTPRTTANESTVALPATKPERVADLDTIVVASGRNRDKAHLPERVSVDPALLCVSADAYNGVTWRITTTTTFPDPDQWLTLCKHCLAAYDREVEL